MWEDLAAVESPCHRRFNDLNVKYLAHKIKLENIESREYKKRHTSIVLIHIMQIIHVQVTGRT